MIDKLREEINAIDDEIAKQFEKRMSVVKKIGNEKAKNNSSVSNASREKEIINRVTDSVSPEIQIYTKQVFSTLFETSKAYQSRFVAAKSSVVTQIEKSLEKCKSKKLPINATVACQGIEGSYSSIAAEKLFEISRITYFKNFKGVFDAVEKGLCQYGLLPVENSTAGSVNEVYDLLKQYKHFVAAGVKLRVQHNFLAKKGEKIADIKQIFSHSQALSQCANFLKQFPTAEVIVCDNTAQAALIVSQAAKGAACISSKECAGIYGLDVLKSNVQDADNNYTRFICISKELEIFENANKISIMVVLEHKPGSLNKVLNKFALLGLNLTKLESRPISNSNFDFMFYFDFEGRTSETEVKYLLSEIENSSDEMTFLGNYSEVS